MRVRFVCKCGLENYTKGDWLCHWKYGEEIENPSHSPKWLGRYPKLRAVYLFLNTSVKVSK